MFVTSDIFDLETIARFRKAAWREVLLGGVDVQGAHWRGYQADARFLVEAAERCGVTSDLSDAGYGIPGQSRTRPLSPKSFGRLIDGKLSGAHNAGGVVLRGRRETAGIEREAIIVGGETHSFRWRGGYPRPIPVPGPPWRGGSDFVFPLDEDPVETARDLFQLAVDILGAEYGYSFVRDDLCGPWTYCHGISAPLDYKALSDDDATEIGDWSRHVRNGGLWLDGQPPLRDLFQANLLSDRHRSALVEGVNLFDWIAAHQGRGRLDDLGQGRALWSLTDAEMVDVRPLLNQAGLLLSCPRRVYRDLPGGGQASNP